MGYVPGTFKRVNGKRTYTSRQLSSDLRRRTYVIWQEYFSRTRRLVLKLFQLAEWFLGPGFFCFSVPCILGGDEEALTIGVPDSGTADGIDDSSAQPSQPSQLSVCINATNPSSAVNLAVGPRN
jgi:hypothetical protein